MPRYNPALIRRRQYQSEELAAVQDSINRATRGGLEYAYGTPVVKYQDYSAKYGEHVLMHPTSTVSLTVYLPRSQSTDVGKSITVTNATSEASALTVSVTDTATIEGADTYASIGAYDTVTFLAADADLFTVV